MIKKLNMKMTMPHESRSRTFSTDFPESSNMTPTATTMKEIQRSELASALIGSRPAAAANSTFAHPNAIAGATSWIIPITI